MCYYDGPPAEFFRESFHKAKSPHKCGECGSRIQPGEKYKSWAAKWNGDFCTGEQCELCARIFSDLTNMDFCPLYNGLWEFIEEEFEQYEKGE